MNSSWLYILYIIPLSGILYGIYSDILYHYRKKYILNFKCICCGWEYNYLIILGHSGNLRDLTKHLIVDLITYQDAHTNPEDSMKYAFAENLIKKYQFEVYERKIHKKLLKDIKRNALYPYLVEYYKMKNIMDELVK